jgi:PadR family transcriptional regulator PadR
MEANRAPRMTQLVLRALLADPAQELYGVEIGQAAGPAQRDRASHPGPDRGRRLADLRLGGHRPKGRGPPGRYYRLTPEGMELAHLAPPSRMAVDGSMAPSWHAPQGR